MIRPFKSILYVAGLSLVSTSVSAQNIGINTTGANPDASAMLDIVSTDKGLLIPRMTSGQRTSIGSPAEGLMVYDTTTDSFWYFDGSWIEITSEGKDGIYGGSGTAPTSTDVTLTDILSFNGGSTMYLDGTANNVGIGTAGVDAKLEVSGDIMATSGNARLRLMRVSGDNYIDYENSNNLYLRAIDITDASPSVNVTFEPGGNVGLGTTTPSEKLDVEGNLQMNEYNIYGGDDVYINDIYNTGEEDAIEVWDDLRMEGSSLIDMPMNMVYSQTTTDVGYGSSFATSRTINVTARTGQRVLLMAWANVDHDDEEVIYVRLTRNGTQIGEITTFEEDDQTGSWTDDFVVYYQWVDVPGDGTWTYDMDIRGDDGSGLTAFSASLVALVF